MNTTIPSTIDGLIETLDNQHKSKADFLINPSSGNVLFLDGQLVMTKHAGDLPITYRPTDYFHSMASEKLKINKTYYDRMRELAPTLLDANVNWWLKAENANLLLRTFEGEQNVARTLLSDRYSVMDNMEVLLETLDAVKKSGVEVTIKQADVTDTRMYLSVICPEVEIQATEMLRNYAKALKVGSGVCSGFIMTNSEVGAGAFSIKPRAVILACNNGMVMTQDSLKKIHLGAKLDTIGMMENSDVKKANIRLVQEQVKHAVKTFLSKDYLQKTIDWYQKLGEPMIEAPITDVIKVIGQEYSISEQRRASILNHFVDGGDRRRIGMFNAITEELQTLGNADVAYESEKIAHSVLINFSKIERRAGHIAKISSN